MNLSLIISKVMPRLTYNQWIIFYDIINNSYYHIKDNLKKERITYEDRNTTLKVINEKGYKITTDEFNEKLRYA